LTWRVTVQSHRCVAFVGEKAWMENFFSRIECKADIREFEEILNYHQWRHRIPIRDGFVTPGYLDDHYWDLSHFPTDLTGKTFLDIGANDGINSFHAERIGAKHVLGIDLYDDIEEMGHTKGWSNRPHKLVKAAIQSNVEFQCLSAYELEKLNRQFDIVLMADVMNWLPDIPTLIAKVAGICKETLIIRDGLMSKSEQIPLLRYVHAPNYDLMYLPNRKFMEVILKENGFKEIVFKKINVDRLFDDWVMYFPLINSDRSTPVYQNPWSNVVLREFQPKQEQALSKVGDRLFLRGIGWVNVADVTPQIFQPRGLFRTARKVLGNDAILKLKNVWKRDIESSYTIIARR
jgi:tRNA (mo5U34)-methyltransferase